MAKQMLLLFSLSLLLSFLQAQLIETTATVGTPETKETEGMLETWTIPESKTTPEIRQPEQVAQIGQADQIRLTEVKTSNNTGLKCPKCHHVNSRGECKSQASVCHTKGSEKFVLRKIYKGGKFLYGFQGCGSACFPTTKVLSVKVKLSCCNHLDFCNSFPEVDHSS